MDKNLSTLGRLLKELSWEGSNITSYRDGGRGYENVLTAETFQALDLLPRSLFLGEILAAAHGANMARQALINEIEAATTTILPGNFYLKKNANSHQEGLAVQPDGIIKSKNCFALLEAKRIKRSSFQAEQLAREYSLIMRESKGKTPLLILVLGSRPPLKVKGRGRLSIEDSITFYIDKVLSQATDHELKREKLITQIPDVISWTTWFEIKQTVSDQKKKLSEKVDNKSIQSSIERVADTVIQAINWHT